MPLVGAVTLRPVVVSGHANAPGVGVITLARLGVTGTAHSATGAAGASVLKHVTVSGALVKPNVVHGTPVLPKLSVVGAAKIGADNTITSAHPVLKHVVVSGTIAHTSTTGAIVLKAVVVHGTLTKGITGGTLGGALLLGRVFANGHLVNKYADLTYEVKCITGNIYSQGTGIFQFRGRSGLGVAWTILTGSGSIAPFGPSYTDDAGIAFAKYDAGGYTGPLKIGVSYVP